MKRIYLDYAATTPVDPRVVKAMLPYLTENFGNTMSLHSAGQKAKIALEQSREVLAKAINADLNEIIFTSSASESNNLALKGVAFSNKEKNHIIISSIEHPCVEESAKWLKSQGWEITKVPVDKFGTVNPEDIEKAITEKTILVSIIHASNEIGTIQNITEIGRICREKNVLFHTDASQSFGKIPIDVKKMNIDLLTTSSHKIYGPKGAGLLFVKKGTRITPLIHGGGQENGLRASTVNVPAIVGFAKAVEICLKPAKSQRHLGGPVKMPRGAFVGESIRIAKMRDRIIKEVLKIEGAHLTGHPTKRLPNIASFYFDFVEGESMIIQLDMYGIECSTGSACSSIKLEPSPILLATGLKPQEAHGSLRISLGRFTKEKDIKEFLKVLPKVVAKIREISPFKK